MTNNARIVEIKIPTISQKAKPLSYFLITTFIQINS